MNRITRGLRRKKKPRERLKPDLVKMLLEKAGLTLKEAIEKGYILKRQL